MVANVTTANAVARMIFLPDPDDPQKIGEIENGLVVGATV